MTRYSVDVCLTVMFISIEAESEQEARQKAIRHIHEEVIDGPAIWKVNYVSMEEEG